MAVLTIDEVGIFRCRFKEIKPCKNPDYCMVAVNFEGLVDGQVKDWSNGLSRPIYLLHTADEVSKIAHLQEGHIYMLKMAIGFNRGSERDGRSYAPGVRYKILEAVKEIN